MDGVDKKNRKLGGLRIGEQVRQRACRRDLEDQRGWLERLNEFSQPFRATLFPERMELLL